MADLVRIAEPPPRRALELRLRDPDEAVLAAVGTVLGVALPRTPNTFLGEEPRVAWLEPAAWLMLGRADPAALTSACAATVHHIADLGHSQASFSISGPASRDLLAMGCSLDLHPSVFGAGCCARSWLARVRVLIVKGARSDEFDVLVDASFATYLRAWFAEAVGRLNGDPT